VASSLVISSQIVFACGDHLVPLGGGVRMERIARAPNPGTVLVLSSSTTPDKRAAEQELVAGLVRAGHQARLITSAEELQAATNGKMPDIVLADAKDLSSAQIKVDAGAAAPVVVMLLVRPDRSQLAAARESKGCVAAMPDWGVSPVLRVVNDIRASQNAGRAAACSEQARLKT